MANSNRDPRQYEMMSILLPDMPEEETQAAIERVKGFITDTNATITQVLTDSPWGRRRLAYQMRFAGVDYRDGYYVLTYFSATPDVLPEIERELKLDTQVIRYLLVADDPKIGEKPGLQGEGGEGTSAEGASQSTGSGATPAPAETAAPAAEATIETAAPAAAPAEEAQALPEAPAAETTTEAAAPAADASSEPTTNTTDAPAGEVAEAAADLQVENTSAAIEGEEAPAPADAPAAKRSSKLPTEGEGADWVAGDGTDSLPDGFPIKGNASSKIYHPQESPNYSNTTAEIYFANGEAAERFGYRLPKTLQNAGAAAGAGLVRSDNAPSEEE